MNNLVKVQVVNADSKNYESQSFITRAKGGEKLVAMLPAFKKCII